MKALNDNGLINDRFSVNYRTAMTRIWFSLKDKLPISSLLGSMLAYLDQNLETTDIQRVKMSPPPAPTLTRRESHV